MSVNRRPARFLTNCGRSRRSKRLRCIRSFSLLAVFASVLLVLADAPRAEEAAKSETVKFSSGAGRCAVLEFYTSEAESDCIPAEEWFSGMKDSAGLWK